MRALASPLILTEGQYIAYVVDLRVGAMMSMVFYEDTARIAEVLQRLGLPVENVTPAPTSEPEP
jgi:hypothetical protein